MGEILENSLTEMDWLLQLNGFAGADSDVQESNEVKHEELDVLCSRRTSAETRHHQVANCKVKPPYSYTYLITSAINSTTRKRMALSEIYQWIRDNYPYYRTAAPGWKNSVRHNLSLNKNFVKVARRKDEPGKGSYWALANFTGQHADSNRKLLPSFSQFSACYRSNNNNNNNNNTDNTRHHYVTTDCETRMAVQSINSIDCKQDNSRTSSLSDELLECEEVLCEVELARSLLDTRHYADLSQHVEWLKNSCSSKFLGTSLASNIDLDLLMESLKAVETTKKHSINLDQFTDLSSSFLSASQPSPVKFISRSPTHSNSHQQFSELQPLTLPTNIADCDRYASIYSSLRSSSPLPPNILDHTEVVSSSCQMPCPISVSSQYPQRTVSVVATDSSATVATGRYDNVTTDDDIDDDFNWDNLIAKDNELMVCAS
jgi:hypothetical protein